MSYVLQWSASQCDPWFQNSHMEHGGKSPGTYTALEMAKKQGQRRVVHIIEELTHGRRQPGDGLPPPLCGEETRSESTTDCQGMNVVLKGRGNIQGVVVEEGELGMEKRKVPHLIKELNHTRQQPEGPRMDYLPY